MSCVRIPPEGDSDASWSADGPPRIADTVLAIDLIFQIVRLFLGDTL